MSRPQRQSQAARVAADREPRGVIFDLKRYALHDGPGIRTTVFLKGCPLTCPWCANAEGRSAAPEVQLNGERCIRCQACAAACPQGAVSVGDDGVAIDRAHCAQCGACATACPSEALRLVGESVSVDELVARVERDRLFFDESGGGVTFSGGEPLAQPEFLVHCLRACRQRELHTAIDTSGAAAAETLTAVAPHADLFLFDLKLLDTARHAALVGVPSELVLENLRWLVANGNSVWVRVPLIPGVNDDDENVAALADFVSALSPTPPVYLLPYHRIGQSKRRRLGQPDPIDAVSPPMDAQMTEIAARLSSTGLTVRIGG